MPCHWETSQRPLFVKSVWQNGYRHAILSKEDPAAKTKSPRLRTTSQSSQERRPKSTKNDETLKIPAVQLLLANARRMKRENTKTAPPNREKLQKSLAFDVILREDIKITSKNNILNKDNNTYSAFNCEKAIYATDMIQQNSKSLTDRVLLWLDLAGRQTKTKKCDNFDGRRFPEKQTEFARIIEDNLESKEIRIVADQIENRFDSDFSILGNQNFEPSKVEIEFEENQFTIANVEGRNLLIRKECLENRFPKSTAKRKVHIFIPSIGNKIPDCPSECSNSILSVDSRK